MRCPNPVRPVATARLLLRPPRLETDASAHLALFSDPATVRHRPDPTPLSAEASRAKLARDVEHWLAHGFGRWALERPDGTVVGFGGVTIPKDRYGFADLVNLSYHLLPAHRGRGYAAELAQAAVRFAFEELEADHVIALARAWNPSSMRVLTRAGLILRREVDLGGAPTLLHAIERRSPTPGVS